MYCFVEASERVWLERYFYFCCFARQDGAFVPSGRGAAASGDDIPDDKGMGTRILDRVGDFGLIVVMQGLQVDGIFHDLHGGERGVCSLGRGGDEGKPAGDNCQGAYRKYTYIYKVCFFHGVYKLY